MTITYLFHILLILTLVAKNTPELTSFEHGYLQMLRKLSLEVSLMYYEDMKISKTQNFLEDTKSEFQQYEDEPITDEKATEIQYNMFGVMDLLLKWKNVFIEEGQKILLRLRQLIGAKNRHDDLDLMLNNEAETDEHKMRQRFPFVK